MRSAHSSSATVVNGFPCCAPSAHKQSARHCSRYKVARARFSLACHSVSSRQAADLATFHARKAPWTLLQVHSSTFSHFVLVFLRLSQKPAAAAAVAIMPISKPVKKQKIILPSPETFYLMPLETKEMILRRLSTDNLITYMDQLVKGKNNRREAANCVTLEQIVDDDGQLESGGTPMGGGIGAYVAIQEWVAKNSALFRANSGGGGGGSAAGNFDLESQQQGFQLSMHSTQSINQGLLSMAYAQPIIRPPNSPDMRRYGGGSGAIGGSSNVSQQQPQQNAFNLSAMSDALSFASHGNRSTAAAAASLYAPLRNIWDNAPSSSTGGDLGGGGGNRWSNAGQLGSGALNKQTASSSAASSGPSQTTGIDFRSGVETPVIFHSDISLGPSSNAATNASISPLGGGFDNFSSRPPLMMGLSPGQSPSKDRQYIPSAAALQAQVKSLWDSGYSAGGSDGGAGRWQQPATATSPAKAVFSTSFKPAIERPPGFGGKTSASVNLQQQMSSAAGASTTTTFKDNFSTCSSSSSNNSSTKTGANKTIVAGVEEMLQLQEPLEEDFLHKYHLPPPEAFNDLSEEEGARLLATLPRHIKNKYEYHCWSCKLNNLLANRPQHPDDSQEEGGDAGASSGKAGEGASAKQQ